MHTRRHQLILTTALALAIAAPIASATSATAGAGEPTSTPLATPVVAAATVESEVPYVLDSTYHAPGADPVALEGSLGTPEEVLRLAAGRLVAFGIRGFTIHEADGSLVAAVPDARKVVANTAGTRLAYTLITDTSSTLGVMTTDGEVLRTKRNLNYWGVFGFRGEEVVLGNTTQTLIWSDRGAVRPWAKARPAAYHEATARLVLVDDAEPGCWQMTDASGRSPVALFTSCDGNYPAQFSPGPGDYLIAENYDDGGVHGPNLVMRAADGAPLLRIDPSIGDPGAPNYIWQTDLADDGSGVVVNILSSSGENGLAFCDFAGQCAPMADPVSAPDVIAYTIASRS